MSDIDVKPEEVKQFVNKQGKNLFSNLSDENRRKIKDLDEKVDGININLTRQIDDLEQDVNDKYNELIRDIDDLTDVVEEDFSTLDTKINTSVSTINQRITDVADEINQTIEENVVALQQEDTALQNQINTQNQTLTNHNTRITTNANAIAQEILDRQNNDDILTGEIENIAGELDSKQNVLVSGQNIKTINNQTILGEGNIDIQGGGASSFSELTGSPYDNTNLKNALNSKQSTLISGINVKTLNNESLLGEGNIDITSAQWGNITGNIENQTDLKNSLQNVREVAEGKTNSYVISYEKNPLFNSQEAEIKLTDIFVDINNNVHDIKELKLGDNIFVQETDVPDRWCSQPIITESLLPDDYTQLEYIESTGTQYINTRYRLNPNRNFEYYLDFTPSGTNTNTCECGTATSGHWSGQRYGTGIYVGGGNYTLNNSLQRIAGIREQFRQTWIGSTVELYKNIYNEPSISRQTINVGNATLSSNTDWYVFGYWFGGGVSGLSKIKLYNHWLKDQDILVFNLIPARRNSDNVLGMYDTVSNTFFTNAGRGEFIPGDAVSKSVTLYKLETSKVDLTEYATKTELNDKQNITDSNLVTLDKTVVGAVNELDAKIREIELYKTPNVLIQGEPTINNGQVTGFSKTAYLILPFEFNVGERGFELTYAFRTGSDVTTAQNLFGSKFSIASYISGGKLTIRVSSNGSSWDILDLITSLNIQPNTTYYIKLIFNKLNYTIKSSADGVEYSQIGYVVDTRPPFAGDVFIGIGNNTNNPFLGTINLHKWELKYNNSVFWEGMDDAGLATRADISLSNLDEQGEARFEAKQDVIDDLEQIRDNASTGAELAPQVAVNTQRIEDLTTARIPDVIYHGTPKITGGQVSNFSTVNFLQFPFEDISRSLPFDIYFSFTTSDDVTTQQNIIDSRFGIALAIQNGKGVMALSSNGTSWDIGSTTGTNTLLPNTTYYVKYSWTGTQYDASLSTNDQTYVPDMILQSNKSPYKTTIYIGGCDQQKTGHTPHPFKGIINFTKSRVVVNGITVWEGMADVGTASRANVSLNNLDEVGEARFTDLQDALLQKQNKLTAGENITIVNNVISATGGGGGGEADTSSNLVLMPNLVVPQVTHGLCTSKDYFNIGNACIINIISKFTYVGNIYSSGDLLRLKRDANNFFSVNIKEYALNIQLKLNGTFIYNLSYNNSMDEYKILGNAYDYAITLDYPNRKLLIRTRTLGKVYKTSLELDISEWDLESLGDFQIVTELGSGYTVTTASKFVVLNEYINYNTYLGEELTTDNFSPFSPTVVSTECVSDGFTMVVNGTRIETISPYYVKNSFNKTSSGYFAMGHYSSKLTKNGNLMITRLRFSEVTAEIALQRAAGARTIVAYDEDYNKVWDGNGFFYPEADKWYIMQVDGGSQVPSYIANYAYYLKGAGNVEVKAIANCFPIKNNIGSINWNGKYFTGYMPFIGNKINFVKPTSFTRIPLYQKKVEGGKLYMYDGSVWKQISS